MAEFEIAGTTFRGGKMFVVLTALSTLGGGAYGAFEFYKDYTDMKEIIQNIDTDEIVARNDIIETKLTSAIDYTRDIKNDLRDDVMKIETLVDRLSDKIDDSEGKIRETQGGIDVLLESVLSDMNQLSRDITASIREIEGVIRESEKDVRNTMRETEDRIDADMRRLDNDIHETLQEALNNPLSD